MYNTTTYCKKLHFFLKFWEIFFTVDTSVLLNTFFDKVLSFYFTAIHRGKNFVLFFPLCFRPFVLSRFRPFVHSRFRPFVPSCLINCFYKIFKITPNYNFKILRISPLLFARGGL